uniref:Uncharacterized protein n=1 Tax=Arundo donax TaxID=35708 RepID=A0A0A9AX15_ARUDO
MRWLIFLDVLVN